jgi:pyridinium-3,5-biscarboxylic acid mononucleotide sulfurtransferase
MPAQSSLQPSGLHPTVESLQPALHVALTDLRRSIAAHPAVLVAYSGGVDSALVAAIAAEQLGERAIAVTGVSPALAPHLREEARQQAAWMGIRQREIPTAELNDPAYSSNPNDRCYACKRELHSLLARLLRESDTAAAVVLDGVNHDDLGDHRPGIRAAQERGVRSPLADLGINKAGVRAISRALGFPWWDKPAQPCLASRFPYGEAISAERLQRVASGEAWLRQHGFNELRVRSQGESARIELPPDQLTALLEPALREALVSAFLDLGFTAVSLDLEGLVSGKLNRGLQRPGA